MAKRDLDFKQFLLHHAAGLLAAELGLHLEAWEPTETEPALQPRERRLDRVFIERLPPRYVHFDVQHTADRMMAHRMHEYGVRTIYSRIDPNEWWPVFSVILWPRRVANIPEPPLRIPVAEGMEIVWPFVNIKIFEWTKAKLESSLPGILILAPLVPDVGVADLAIYAQRLYNGTDGDERRSAGALFFTFVEDRYRKSKQWPRLRAQVLTMLRKVGFGLDFIDEVILNTDIVENAVLKAEQHGLAVGIAEGKMVGIAEGKAGTLRRLWAKKFGPLSEDVEARIAAAPIHVLDQITEQMLDPTYTHDQARHDLGLTS